MTHFRKADGMDASPVTSRGSLLWRVIAGVIHSAPIVLVMIAIGAGPLGVDSDQKWGPFRVGLLILGMAGLAVLVGLKVVNVLDRRLAENRWPFGFLRSFERKLRWPQRFSGGWRQYPLYQESEGTALSPSQNFRRSMDSPSLRSGSARGPWWTGAQKPATWIAFGLLLVGIELVYVFLVSTGHWTVWPTSTQYYDSLARAFIHGEVALPIEPSPRLAELDDPYDPASLVDIPILYDASYFRGKYYLYWGPAPAVATGLWKLLSNSEVGDEHITFVAITTISVFSTLTIHYLKRRYYPCLPSWLLFASVLIVTTSHPLLWVLNSPSIYAAAIASGQAFLVAGLFFAIAAIAGEPMPVWRFALAGILWGLALGSRLTLAGAIAVLCITIGVRLPSVSRSRGGLVRLSALALPLMTGVGLLGLYNHARFGSIFETGLRYQVSKLDFGPIVDGGWLFEFGYALPNLFYYLLAPLRFRSLFPFIRPLFDELPSLSAVYGRLHVPSFHHVENITGLLFSVPTILFIGFWVLDLTRGPQGLSRPTSGLSRSTGPVRNRGYVWTTVPLLLAGVAAAIPTILLFWVTNRYLLDSVPLLAITAAVGAWSIYDSGRMYPFRRAFVSTGLWSVVILGLVVSFLLAMTGDSAQFDDLNPVVWKSLTDFFAR